MTEVERGRMPRAPAGWKPALRDGAAHAGMVGSVSFCVAVKRVHGSTLDRVAWRVASSMDSVDWVQRKVTKSIRRGRRWTPMGRSRNPGTGTAAGYRLTAGRDGRTLAVSAMSPKPHSYRCLHEELVPGASSRPTSSKTGSDQNGVNLRSATWSTAAENQLTKRTVPGYFRMAMVAAEGEDADVGVDCRAPADGRVDARAEPAAGRARPPREASESGRSVSRVKTDPPHSKLTELVTGDWIPDKESE